VMAESGMDRRRVGGDIGRPVGLRCLGQDVEPTAERVTSAAVVAFTADGDLVAADLERGPDLPEGHVQRDDASLDAAVRRETWEEVRAHLGALRRIEVIESDYFGPDDLTYMVIFAARVLRIAEWEGGDDKSRGPVVLEPEEFLQRYRAGDAPLMRHLVTAAQADLHPTPQAP
jgi:8-oxo-dGTP diphosphatase